MIRSILIHLIYILYQLKDAGYILSWRQTRLQIYYLRYHQLIGVVSAIKPCNNKRKVTLSVFYYAATVLRIANTIYVCFNIIPGILKRFLKVPGWVIIQHYEILHESTKHAINVPHCGGLFEFVKAAVNV